MDEKQDAKGEQDYESELIKNGMGKGGVERGNMNSSSTPFHLKKEGERKAIK